MAEERLTAKQTINNSTYVYNTLFSPHQDFVYGFQRWNVSFVRSDRHIGAFLKLQTPSQGLRCRLDFSFTVVNRDHFTKNVSFIEKSCEFSPETNVFGRKTFIEIDDLIKRNFLHESGDLLVEVEMRNIHSIYECFMRLPKEGGGSGGSRHGYGDRMESTYFMFGLSDWSISLFPDNSVAEADGSVEVQLQRHTSFDHLCYVRYRIILGDEGTFDSGDLEQVLDASGVGEPFTIGASVHRLSRGRSTLRVKVEMISVVSVSEVYLNAFSRSNNQSRAHFYDRDKQAWMVEADSTGKYLAFRLFYTDISHVPRKFSRYVGWNFRIISKATNARAKRALDGPFSRYYVQQEADDGCVIRTDVTLEELKEPECPYMDTDDRKLTLHIEWLDSHLLINPNYTNLDDVGRLHKHQMSREILALQAENYALEKQLYSYQQSLAKTSAKDGPSSRNTSRANSYDAGPRA
ncbi:uncharacterized protein LOC101859992 [Aplysia californica]|uniref:Uncharacterized protein LOC101859992 n=1 Tax=Aplysia californica TaxID=6500 RepID=A0ABM1W3Z7_APLCA|nr:uncharacterized protein LOC101859992 [Aplysia californica]